MTVIVIRLIIIRPTHGDVKVSTGGACGIDSESAFHEAVKTVGKHLNAEENFALAADKLRPSYLCLPSVMDVKP